MEVHGKSQGVAYEDFAQKEWGWEKIEFSLPEMVTDFYAELETHPEWYR
jgi:hypothetical protein